MFYGIVKTRDGSEWRSDPKGSENAAISAAMGQVNILRIRRRGKPNPPPETLSAGAFVEYPDGSRSKIRF